MNSRLFSFSISCLLGFVICGFDSQVAISQSDRPENPFPRLDSQSGNDVVPNGEPQVAREINPKVEQRDPTSPSPEILSRLLAQDVAEPPITEQPKPASPIPQTVVNVLPALPELRIKAIVFSDRDHGSVILSSGTRKVSVRLSRDVSAKPNLSTEKPNAEPSVGLNGFAIGDVFFQVESFNEQAVLLRALPHNALILVQ